MEKVLFNERMKECIHINILPSGLKCYIMPKKGYMEKQALLAVNFGSVDTVFSVDQKDYRMPEGIAHFLEHKIFEDEKRNIFDLFTAQGADVNAYTNYNTTAYHFNCIDRFDENLSLLLQFVLTPYFTNENIEKEKGIITQEIRMYQDYPSWRVFFNMQAQLYPSSPLSQDIAGSAESVAAINKDMLDTCYDAFYRPENMALFLVGDVDAHEIYRICEREVKKVARPVSVMKKAQAGSEEIKGSFIEAKMNLSKPLFNIGFRDKTTEFSKGQLIACTKALLDIIFGESSQFYHELYLKGLLDSSFGAEYVCGPNYGTTILSGYSHSPKEFLSLAEKEIQLIKKKGIDERRAKQIIKKHQGKYLLGFNSIDMIGAIQADLWNKDLTVLDLYDHFEDLSLAVLEKRLKTHFDFNRAVLSVISPESS